MQVARYPSTFKIVACVGLCCGVSYACSGSPKVVEELKSPSGVYVIDLKGPTQPHWNLLRTSVTASARNKTKSICEWPDLYDKWDFLDDSLYTRFDRPNWPVDNVLQFRRKLKGVVDKRDALLVKNESGAPVSCAKIAMCDLILAIDIKPGESVSLNVSRQPGGVLSFYAEATVGGSVFTDEISFDRDDYNSESPITGVVTVSKIGVSLSRSQP